MKLKVTYELETREGVAELLAATKHFELCPTVGILGEKEMSGDDVVEAFELIDLISAEFRSDPTSVQCFDTRIVNATNALAKKWNEEGRP